MDQIKLIEILRKILLEKGYEKDETWVQKPLTTQQIEDFNRRVKEYSHRDQLMIDFTKSIGLKQPYKEQIFFDITSEDDLDSENKLRNDFNGLLSNLAFKKLIGLDE